MDDTLPIRHDASSSCNNVAVELLRQMAIDRRHKFKVHVERTAITFGDRVDCTKLTERLAEVWIHDRPDTLCQRTEGSFCEHRSQVQ